MATKKTKQLQIYEKYWSITLEYSDYAADNFNNCLKTIVDFIDTNNCDKKGIYNDFYQPLQDIIYKLNPKSDYASVRKAINQFLKLGFINNFGKGYHKKTKEFLEEKNSSRKKRLYSEILYDNASFNRSMKNPNNVNEINFLIKTLEYCGSLSKKELSALMFVDISKYKKGYLTLDELKEQTGYTIADKRMERKYNQVNYLMGLCKNVLAGIYYSQADESITIDEPDYIDSTSKKGRDPYKQRLYKYELYDESNKINKTIKCYCEGLKFPILIASHIKPYVKCNENEQFDKNNGLLLSPNIDSLFDKGWITFNEEGKIICASSLDKNIKDFLATKTLNAKFLNEARLKFLEYHRTNVFKAEKQCNYK